MQLPLLSPKAFADFSPEEFKAYVVSLYQAPPKREPPKEVRASRSKKGVLTFRISREPKYITADEVFVLAEELAMPAQELWLLLLKRKFEIRTPERKRKKR